MFKEIHCEDYEKNLMRDMTYAQENCKGGKVPSQLVTSSPTSSNVSPFDPFDRVGEGQPVGSVSGKETHRVTLVHR